MAELEWESTRLRQRLNFGSSGESSETISLPDKEPSRGAAFGKHRFGLFFSLLYRTSRHISFGRRSLYLSLEPEYGYQSLACFPNDDPHGFPDFGCGWNAADACSVSPKRQIPWLSSTEGSAFCSSPFTHCTPDSADSGPNPTDGDTHTISATRRNSGISGGITTKIRVLDGTFHRKRSLASLRLMSSKTPGRATGWASYR